MAEHDHDHNEGSNLSEMELRVRALETILVDKGYIESAALDRIVELYETKIGPHIGAQVVAKAWSDPAFRQALLKEWRALGVPIEELLASPRAKVRKWSESDVSSQSRGNGVTLRGLIPEPMPEGILSVMDFAPGGAMRGTPHLPGTREYFTCLEGQVTIFVAGERNDLIRGDVLAFPGNVPHSYQNPDATRGARGVSVVILAKAGV